MKDLEEEVRRGFQNLEDAQSAELNKINEKLDEKLESQNKWLSNVEAQINTARFGGTHAGDGLLRAVPQEYRPMIQKVEAMGHKDAARKFCFDYYWHLQYMGVKSQRSRTGKRDTGDWYKLSDDLEKAMGFDPAQKFAYAKAALGEVVGSGAAIIATPVEAELYRMISDNTVVRPLATKIVMTSLTHQVPVENSNVTAYIVPETTVITDAMPVTTFAQRPMTGRVFAGLATVSNQLLEDQIIGLQQYVFSAVAERIGILEDQGALDGGTPAVQNFSGIAVSAGVNSFGVNATGVSGGSVPTYAEMVRAVFEAAQASTRQGGAFFMLPAAFKNLVSLVDTTGQPIFTFGTVPGSIPTMLGGYPIYTVSSLSSAWSAATTSTNIYYGPPAKILYGDYASGTQFDIDPFSLMEKVQTRIRVLKRTAILVPVGSMFTVMRQVKYT